MGKIFIDMSGSFPADNYCTPAEVGGHVMALRRSIEFLTSKLGWAVKEDANLNRQGIAPPGSPLGEDVQRDPYPRRNNHGANDQADDSH